eukprot:PhM_4_TR1301/c1_g1_i6/m.105362
MRVLSGLLFWILGRRCVGHAEYVHPNQSVQASARGAVFFPAVSLYGSSGRGSVMTCGDVHPHPGPSHPFRCLQWNACALTAETRVGLVAQLNKRDPIDIVLLSETHWVRTSSILPGWSIYAAHGVSTSGGVAIMLRDTRFGSSTVEVFAEMSGPKCQLITLRVKYLDPGSSSGDPTDFLITSAYVSPSRLDLEPVLVKMSSFPEELPHVVAGDFNCHHPLWDLALPADNAGIDFADWAATSGLIVQNDANVPTRPKPRNFHQKASSPDITLAKDIEVLSWETADPVGYSDHAFIHFAILTDLDPDDPEQEIADLGTMGRRRRPFYSFKKANWANFQSFVEGELAKHDQVPRDVRAASKVFTSALLDAAKAHIPRGSVQNNTPYGSIMRRNDVRALTAIIRTTDDLTTYRNAKQERRRLVNNLLNESYKEKVESLDPSVRQDWRFLKSIRNPHQPHIATDLVAEDGTIVTSERGRAKALLERFKKVGSGGSVPGRIRCDPAPDVNDEEIRAALSQLKSGKACGKDGVYTEFLQHLGPIATKWLRTIVRRSVVKGSIPRPWKHGVIIPLLKPEKDPKVPASYRPVTLTSVLAKLTERVIATRLIYHLEQHLHHSQYGFRAGRSTVDVVRQIIDETIMTFNTYNLTQRFAKEKQGMGRWRKYEKCGRAAAVFFDLSAAFDRVDHKILIEKMSRLDIPDHIIRWVRNFLTHRKSQVRVNDTFSRETTFKSGVPQGTILGPILFAIYLNDLLQSLSDDTECDPFAFADDLTVLAVGKEVTDCTKKLQKASDIVHAWCVANKMEVSPKSQGCCFMRSKGAGLSVDDASQYTVRCGQTNIIVKGHPPKLPRRAARAAARAPVDPDDNDGLPGGNVENENSDDDAVSEDHAPDYEVRMRHFVRLLGIILDPGLNMDIHVKHIASEVQRRISQLSAIAGFNWGPSPHLLRIFYKNYIECVLLYGCEAWWHRISESNKETLRVLQRRALRIITGCLACTTVEDLHREAKVPPLDIIAEYNLLRLHVKDARLPEGDPRRTAAVRPVPPPPRKLVHGGYTTVDNTSQSSATELLASYGLPELDMVENTMVTRQTSPFDLQHVDKVTVAPQLVEKLEPDSPAPDRLRLNERTLDGLRRGVGGFDWEMWTDASIV